MSESNAIVAKGLTKSFKKLKVLHGIDFAVRRGTIMALLGPNGAGKTTTIRILATLLAPDDGRAAINGYDVLKEADGVRTSIGLTGQSVAVDGYLTGRENLLMMGKLYKLEESDIKRRTEELLLQFDLVEAADRAVKTYSGGMKRRLDLGMSLMASPPVLFLDEPTTGLDPRSRLTMWEIIKRLVAEGTTILLTTQYMEEADQLADTITVIDDGKIIAQGTANELKRRVGSERLELVLKRESDLKHAEDVVDGKDLRVEAKNRTLSIAAEGGVRQVQEVLNKLRDATIEVESLSLHHPTLDDVFLSLTGHEAVEQAEEEKGGT